MTRVRGRTIGKYVTDGATEYRCSVDSDRFAGADFGWTSATSAMNQLPRGAKPRHVSGLSATSGRRAVAIVPVITAAIWTGAATTFDVEADDGTIDTMTVTAKFNERPSLN